MAFAAEEGPDASVPVPRVLGGQRPHPSSHRHRGHGDRGQVVVVITVVSVGRATPPERFNGEYEYRYYNCTNSARMGVEARPGFRLGRKRRGQVDARIGRRLSIALDRADQKRARERTGSVQEAAARAS